MRLDHCCLNVRDMDQAIDFYTTHFGLKLLSRREITQNNAEIAFVGTEEDGMKLELTHWRDWTDDEFEEGTQFDHVALVTDEDLDAVFERLEGAGVEIAKPPFKLGGSSSSKIGFVLDLDGNWVELIQRG